MSIYSQIRSHLGTSLFRLPFAVEGEEWIRDLVLSSEVWDAVRGPFPENRDGERHAEFRAYLEAFASGEEISVSENPFQKSSYTFMARVHPIGLDVWDIRVMELRPGIRCFGCIGDSDLFVALTWDYRENIEENAEGFKKEALRCREAWDKLFTCQPKKGNASGLLSNIFAS